MDQTQQFLLVILLPAVLAPLLMGLAAGLGIARWRGTLLVFALIALTLYIVSAVIFYILNVSMFNERLGLPGPDALANIERLQQISVYAYVYSGVFGAISVFLALVLAGRARQWGWFTFLLIAAVLSAIAIEFALSISGLGIFVKDDKRALEIFSTSLYTIIVNALAMLSLLVQVAYAIFGARTTATVAPAASVASTASMSDDVTLP